MPRRNPAPPSPCGSRASGCARRQRRYSDTDQPAFWKTYAMHRRGSEPLSMQSQSAALGSAARRHRKLEPSTSGPPRGSPAIVTAMSFKRKINSHNLRRRGGQLHGEFHRQAQPPVANGILRKATVSPFRALQPPPLEDTKALAQKRRQAPRRSGSQLEGNPAERAPRAAATASVASLASRLVASQRTGCRSAGAYLRRCVEPHGSSRGEEQRSKPERNPAIARPKRPAARMSWHWPS